MLSQLPPSQWNERTAAHLLNRAAFGATPEEIAGIRAKGPQLAVQNLVEPAESETSPAPPDWAHPRDLRSIRQEARMAKKSGDTTKIRAARQMEGEEILDLRRWWIARMATTNAPLLEKMTLFWHGHFATSMEKVKDGYWMWQQNDTIRRHALGNFTTLTKEMSRDPAMMIYLDLPQNRREHPNENWARELMELFTVGIGNYTEHDVREAARAFTGYRLDLITQRSWFAPNQHDGGPKTFLGRSGNFNGDDIIDILAKQPACAQFIARKLCRFFIEEEPSEQVIAAVADRLRAHNLEMKPVLREIFLSAEFYSERVLRAQIKSPTQFMVQTCKLLQCDLPAPRIAQNAMRQMGQVLFAPPNVKGWDGGKSWISTSTLLFRNNFADYLINGDAILPPQIRRQGADLGFSPAVGATVVENIRRDPINISKIVSAEARNDGERLIADLSQRLLQTDPAANDKIAFTRFLEARKGDLSDATIRGLLHLMMSTPLYQLT